MSALEAAVRRLLQKKDDLHTLQSRVALLSTHIDTLATEWAHDEQVILSALGVKYTSTSTTTTATPATATRELSFGSPPLQRAAGHQLPVSTTVPAPVPAAPVVVPAPVPAVPTAAPRTLRKGTPRKRTRDADDDDVTQLSVTPPAHARAAQVRKRRGGDSDADGTDLFCSQQHNTRSMPACSQDSSVTNVSAEGSEVEVEGVVGGVIILSADTAPTQPDAVVHLQHSAEKGAVEAGVKFFVNSRNKENGQVLPAVACPQCREFFDALRAPEALRDAHLQSSGRHRCCCAPSETPPTFWDHDSFV